MSEFDRRKFLKTTFLGFVGILTIFSTFKPLKLWSRFNRKEDSDSVFIPRDTKL